jgi:hypothetical protein
VLTSLGHNIVSDTSGGITGPDALTIADPLLGPLADNGGPTWTHAPFLCSPAINAGPPADWTDADGNPIATDQRGVTRPQGAACDIGSVEMVLSGTFNIPDGDVCGLIAAINAANTSPGADTINLAPGGTYTLTAVNNSTAGDSGLPAITSQITINGNGATIQRDLGAPSFRIFYIAGPNAGDLTVNRVTVRGGGLFSTGGGIHNRGTLKVIDSLVIGNRGDGGAGIYNENGVVELIKSTVSGNADRFFGAGIYNDGNAATLTLNNSSITGNSGRLRGTGIYNDAGTATLINSTVSGNIHGTGIGNDAGGKVTLINSTVSGNGGTAPDDGGGI